MASIGVPHFGPHFQWREPLAVRRAVAPDPWHNQSISSKFKRAFIAMAPFCLLVVLAPFLRSKSAPPVSLFAVGVLIALIIVVGLMVGFLVPLANHFTKRRIHINGERVQVCSGTHAVASKRVSPIIDTYPREQVVAIRFERRTFGTRSVEIMCLRPRHGTEVFIGLSACESPVEVRKYLIEWGYPVV